MEEEKDVSKSFVIFLVIVSVIVSLLGTWTVLEESNNVSSQKEVYEQTNARGEVSISIIEPPKMPQATGKFSLEIIKQGE